MCLFRPVPAWESTICLRTFSWLLRSRNSRQTPIVVPRAL
ncbi:hypothetical protein EVA_06900 [gut metagenome]|uniref:Uncharacterized protein n=1 Tax=gut metagenome TaxID=749906 RepID=J9GDN2_9ZZZZ